MNTDLTEYYRLRAREYEAIYRKTERREDLNALAILLQHTFTGLDVFETACGTGYWTEKISETARTVTASDINGEVLAVARSKSYGCPVFFQQEDLFSPVSGVDTRFDALFGGFIWSHISTILLIKALENLSKRVRPGGRLLFIDNRFVDGSSTPIHSRDADGNTYQLRTLSDDSQHLVLKNFPSPDEIHRVLSGIGKVKIQELTYFWMAECTLI